MNVWPDNPNTIIKFAEDDTAAVVRNTNNGKIAHKEQKKIQAELSLDNNVPAIMLAYWWSISGSRGAITPILHSTRALGQWTW